MPGLAEYREQHHTGDVVFGLRVAHELGKGARVALIINNLLNREYMGRPGDIQKPRTYVLAATIKI